MKGERSMGNQEKPPALAVGSNHNSDGDDRGNPCEGMATSFFYMCPQDMLARATPAIEWYRPSQAELDVEGAYTSGERDHVASGGLLSRPNRSAIMARVRAEAAEAEVAMTPEDKARHAELLASIESRKTQAPYGGKVPGSGKVPSDTAS